MTEPIRTPDVKLRLLQAAEEVFAEKGFAAATTREITDRAGANIAAINYHFGDKERLYIEAVKYAHECSGKHTPFPPMPPEMPAVEKLRLFIREMTHRMTITARPSSLQLTMRELSNPTTAAAEVVRDYIQPLAFMLRDLIRELRPALTETQRLMIGFSIIGQILYYRQNWPVSELIFGKAHIDALNTTDIAGHIERFSLAALGYDSPVGKETS